MFKARMVITLFILVLCGMGATYTLVSGEHNTLAKEEGPIHADSAVSQVALDLARNQHAALSSLNSLAARLLSPASSNPAEVLASKGKALGADLLWWVDAKGSVKARLEDAKRAGDDVSALPPIANALHGLTTQEVMVVAGRLHNIVAVPLFDEKSSAVTGALLAGFAVNAERLQSKTPGTTLVVILEGNIASIKDEALRPVVEALLAAQKTVDVTPHLYEPKPGDFRAMRYALAGMAFPFSKDGRFSGVLAVSTLNKRWLDPFREQGRLILLGGLVFFVLSSLATLITSAAVNKQAKALAAQVQMVYNGEVAVTKFNRRLFYKELDPLIEFVLKAATQKAIEAANPTTYQTLGRSTANIGVLNLPTPPQPPAPALEATGSHAVMEELTAMIERRHTSTPVIPTLQAGPATTPQPQPAVPVAGPRTTLDKIAEETKTASFGGPGTPTRPAVLRATLSGTPLPQTPPQQPVLTARPTQPPAPAPRPAPAAAAQMTVSMASSPSIPIIDRPIPDDENEYFEQVFNEYLNLRDRLGQPTHTVNRERFLENLRGNAARIKAAKSCRKVRYTVFEKEGQAQVKASPIA